MSKATRPPHPGKVLREKFLEPAHLAASRLAIDLRLHPQTIHGVANEQRGITPNIALRLARYFGTPPEYWMNLVTAYELGLAEEQYGDEVRMDVRPRASTSYYHDIEGTQVIEVAADPDFYGLGEIAEEAASQHGCDVRKLRQAILDYVADIMKQPAKEAPKPKSDIERTLDLMPPLQPLPSNFDAFAERCENVTDYPDLEAAEPPVQKPQKGRGRPRKFA